MEHSAGGQIRRGHTESNAAAIWLSDLRGFTEPADRDTWATVLLVKRYGGDNAMLEAVERADQLPNEGDMAGAETWHRILNAIERLQAKAPAEGEKVH